MSTNNSMLVLTKEPFAGYMPKDLFDLLDEDLSEEQVSLIFAHVANKTASLFCALDEGDAWVRYAFYSWEEVHQKLMDMIFAILVKEGTVKEMPSAGKYYALMPFMERNGYCCASGWWVPKENERSPAG